MKKISKISIFVIAVALTCGIASLCVNSNSVMFEILDTTAVFGFLTLFTFGTVAMANASKEIQLIMDTPHRVIMKTISNFSGIFFGAASLGLITLMIIAAIQNVGSVRELSFYGKTSSLIAFTIGTLFFFISKKVNFRSDDELKKSYSETQIKLIKKFRKRIVVIVIPTLTISATLLFGAFAHGNEVCAGLTVGGLLAFFVEAILYLLISVNNLHKEAKRDSAEKHKELQEIGICEVNSFIKYLFGVKLGDKIEKSWIMQ